jgi:hypothetical protein
MSDSLLADLNRARKKEVDPELKCRSPMAAILIADPSAA